MRTRDYDDDGNSALLLKAAAGLGLFFGIRALVRQHRWYDLAGKAVVITGGSRGLGLVLAREFGALGARVAICARDEAELARAKFDLRERNVSVEAIACDVTRPADVQAMVREVVGRFGGIDVLVNNAGVIQVGPMEVMTEDDYREAMDVHYWAPLRTILETLPVLRARGGGRIVNISSIGGKVAAPHLLPYTGSKFALTGLSEGLRVELKKDNIYVTTVCPGLMRTGSPRNAYFKGQHRDEYAWFAISDSLPLTSMDAARAARRVVLACQRGESEVVLSIQAKLAVKFHALFPGLATEINSLVNRLLPAPGGIYEQRVKGKQSESFLAPSVLTALSEKAARANNEF